MPKAASYQSYTSPPNFAGYTMPPVPGYYPYDMGYQGYPAEPVPAYDMGIPAPIDPSQNYNYTYSPDPNYYAGYSQPVAPEHQQEGSHPINNNIGRSDAFMGGSQEDSSKAQFYAPPMPGTGYNQDGYQQ